MIERAVDVARRFVLPGAQTPLFVLARRRDDALELLKLLAHGRGADAVAARLTLEHVGRPVERPPLADDLCDLAALAHHDTASSWRSESP